MKKFPGDMYKLLISNKYCRNNMNGTSETKEF